MTPRETCAVRYVLPASGPPPPVRARNGASHARFTSRFACHLSIHAPQCIPWVECAHATLPASA